MINKYPTIFWYILFLFLNLCRQYIHFIASNQGRLCPLPALGIPLPSLWRLCRFSFHPAPRKPPAFFCNNAMLWEVASVMPDSLRPYGLSPPVCGILQARILKWVAMPFSRDLPDSGIEPASLVHWQADSLPLCHQTRLKQLLIREAREHRKTKKMQLRKNNDTGSGIKPS